jgi:glycerophosphoryl diester phosphodiesterase
MLIIGHRGAKGLAPENTMASLQAGIDAGASTVEIDVRVTKDNVPVLYHDTFIKTTEGKALLIAKNDFLLLQQAKRDLITLEAALQFIDRRVDTIIELKPHEPTTPVIAAIEPRIMKHWLESDIILASKDFKTLLALHKAFPQIPVAVIEPWSGIRARMRAKKLNTKRIIMNQKWLWRGYISATEQAGYKLTAYTLNDPVKGLKWSKAGLYGAITDYPDRF